jgi:hypothetical protein
MTDHHDDERGRAGEEDLPRGPIPETREAERRG